MSRKLREAELLRLIPDIGDVSQLSDVEVNSLISRAIRKAIDKDERGERPPRRRRRR